MSLHSNIITGEGMSTRKLGTYATREEFLENEIRSLNFYIQSMIDTMKVTSMNRQDMLDELERMKQEIKTAVLAEREACAKVCEQTNDGTPYNLAEACAEAIRARGQA
jgi:predicted HTH transcriptional regulator